MTLHRNIAQLMGVADTPGGGDVPDRDIWLKMNEGSGNKLYDAMGGGQIFAIDGMDEAFWKTGGPAQGSTHYLDFSASSVSNRAVSGNALLGAGSFTTSIFVKFEVDPPGSYNLSMGTNSGNGNFYLTYTTNRKSNLSTGNNGFHSSEALLQLGEWSRHTVRADIPNERIDVFADGVNIISSDYTGYVTNDWFFIFATGSGGYPFRGQIDDLSIWQSALTDEQIASL